MNRSQSLLARIAACTIALLAADGAAADVTLSVVDATPTALHDGTLPGIGERIFSADVHVEVTPEAAWWAGAIDAGVFEPGVRFYQLTDPNTGGPILTAPGYGLDEREFATFVNLPAPQLVYCLIDVSAYRAFRGRG